MNTAPDAPSHLTNHLLAALTPDLFAKAEPHLSIVELKAGVVLFEPGDKLDQIYFPHDCVLSLVASMRDGGIAEMATIGREGMHEAMSWRNGGKAMALNLVQITGTTSVIDAAQLGRLYSENPGLQGLFNRYVESLLMQALQMVACNAVHSVEARACRWILMTHDRVGRDHFGLTHELLAQMLGVQRPTVSVVARTLQTASLIKQERASITVTNRQGLEESACECYGVIRESFRRYLPGIFAD